MTQTTFLKGLAGACALGLAIIPSAIPAAYADDAPTALSHAPIGVMGDHLHDKGEFMLSYRYSYMSMEGNRVGTDSIGADEIVTTIPNRTGMPPTLRVVPVEMPMQMHMIGAMYAPTDWLTLMGMTMYMTMEMDHLTYQGMMGATELGTFTTDVSGFGDSSITALIKLYKKEHLSVHLNAGLSLPTGSIDETDTVLTPMNTQPELRLPYAMQLGSGTVDLKPGITLVNRSHDGRFGGGAQYMATIRTGENDENYTLGDVHQLTGWGQYAPVPSLAFSLRGTLRSTAKIDGSDAMIMAPVQTANPDFYGGEVFEVGAGANWLFIGGALDGHRVAAEVSVPVHQDLNGPQMENDYNFTLGWQKAW